LANGSVDLSIQTWLHPRGWLIVPLRVGSLIALDFVLDTAYPVTRISLSTRDLLEAFGYVTALQGHIYRLREMRVEGHTLAELEVRASRPVWLRGQQGTQPFDDHELNALYQELANLRGLPLQGPTPREFLLLRNGRPPCSHAAVCPDPRLRLTI